MTDHVSESAPANPGPAQPPFQPEPKQSAGSAIGKLILRIAVPIVVILVGGFVWNNLTGDPSTASVGECLIGGSADDMKIVACDDAQAQYKVIGKVEGKTEGEFNASDTICEAHPTATSAFWSGRRGGKGDVLCLEPLKK